MFLVLYIRWYLQRENKRRDLSSADQSEDDLGVVIEIDENGQKVERTVSDNQLDLTDRQNLVREVRMPPESPTDVLA